MKKSSKETAARPLIGSCGRRKWNSRPLTGCSCWVRSEGRFLLIAIVDVKQDRLLTPQGCPSPVQLRDLCGARNVLQLLLQGFHFYLHSPYTAVPVVYCNTCKLLDIEIVAVSSLFGGVRSCLFQPLLPILGRCMVYLFKTFCNSPLAGMGRGYPFRMVLHWY